MPVAMVTSRVIVLVTLCLVSLTRPHKIGLLLEAAHPTISASIQDVGEYTLSRLDSSLELVVQEYGSTYMSLLDALCGFLEDGVVAVTSSSTSTLTAVEADVLSQFNVPYIAAVATNPYLRAIDRDYLMLMAPSDKYQSQAIFALLKEFKWNEFSILASADDRGINGVVYLQYLATRDSDFDIKDVQHFDVSNYRNISEFSISKELLEIKDSLTRVIVLNCGGDYAKLIFKEANNMGLMNEDFVWIVSDSVAGDQEKISYDGSYPTYYEGLFGTVPAYGQGSEEYNSFKNDYIMDYGGASSNLMMSAVLISDALTILHNTISNLDGTSWDSSPSLSCTSTNTWPGGQTLFSAITSNSYDGISGVLGFNDDGVALSTSYDIMNFKGDSFQKVGTWSNTSDLEMGAGVVFAGGQTSAPTGYGSSLTGFHLRVGIVQENPIAYLRDTCVDLDTSSPECWYGWNPDIIARLASDLNFTYEYVVPSDSRYGGYNATTKTWNGMMGDIIAKETDFTMALSINTERSSYIEFTHSFFEDQASFVVLQATTESTANAFFFLLPFESSVWVSVVAMVVVLSLMMTVLSKLSPYGRYGRKLHAMQTCLCLECGARRDLKLSQGKRFSEMKHFECEVERTEEEDSMDDMSFYNSFFVVGAGFVGQGGESLPYAPSGRFLLFCWWLFVMILINMYTANLTAHLTLERSSISVTSLEHLVKSQHDYKWGVITDRNLESMMKNRDETYKKIVDEGYKLTSVQEGIEKVNDGGFIFIDESSVLSFNFAGNCDVTQTDTGKFSNEWALGLQLHSPYKALINTMFLVYREEGWFTTVWDEWYTSDTSCDSAVGSDMKFDLPILSGLFYIFFIGVACSFILVILETLYVSHLDSLATSKAGFWGCLKRRLQFKRHEIAQEWLGFPMATRSPRVHEKYDNGGKMGWVQKTAGPLVHSRASGELWLESSSS